MTNNLSPPTVVDGIVFERSGAKTLGLILLNILLFLFGVFLIWAKVGDRVVYLGTEIPQKVAWWGLILGIGLAIIAPVAIAMLVRLLWVKRRVVIGADRLQVVEHLYGRDVVVLQIPYANVAEFLYEATTRKRQLGIDLHRLDDPQTYARSDKFEQNKHLEGRHFSISTGYRKGPRAITAAMERAYDGWRAS